VTSTHCLCSHRKAAARLANGGGLDFLLIHYERRIATARSHDFSEDFCGCFAADRLSARPCTRLHRRLTACRGPHCAITSDVRSRSRRPEPAG
jgi:hypothetical protein